MEEEEDVPNYTQESLIMDETIIDNQNIKETQNSSIPSLPSPLVVSEKPQYPTMRKQMKEPSISSPRQNISQSPPGLYTEPEDTYQVPAGRTRGGNTPDGLKMYRLENQKAVDEIVQNDHEQTIKMLRETNQKLKSKMLELILALEKERGKPITNTQNMKVAMAEINYLEKQNQQYKDMIAKKDLRIAELMDMTASIEDPQKT